MKAVGIALKETVEEANDFFMFMAETLCLVPEVMEHREMRVDNKIIELFVHPLIVAVEYGLDSTMIDKDMFIKGVVSKGYSVRQAYRWYNEIEIKGFELLHPFLLPAADYTIAELGKIHSRNLQEALT